MAESVALVGVHGGQKAAEWRESSLVCELWKLHLHQISTGATLYPPKDAIKLVVPSLSSSVFSLVLAFLLFFLPVLV